MKDLSIILKHKIAFGSYGNKQVASLNGGHVSTN